MDDTSIIRRKSNKREVAGVLCITSLQEVLNVLGEMEGKAKSLALNWFS